MKRGIEFEVNIYLLQPYQNCFCCLSFFAENVKVDLYPLEFYTNDASFNVSRKSNLKMSEFRALLPSFLPGVELNEQKNSQFSTERVSLNRHLRIK